MAKKKAPSELHDAAVRLGHKGGLKGGPARAAELSAEQRSEIAAKAAKARWAKAEYEKRKPSQTKKTKPTAKPKPKPKPKKDD